MHQLEPLVVPLKLPSSLSFPIQSCHNVSLASNPTVLHLLPALAMFCLVSCCSCAINDNYIMNHIKSFSLLMDWSLLPVVSGKTPIGFSGAALGPISAGFGIIDGRGLERGSKHIYRPNHRRPLRTEVLPLSWFYIQIPQIATLDNGLSYSFLTTNFGAHTHVTCLALCLSMPSALDCELLGAGIMPPWESCLPALRTWLTLDTSLSITAITSLWF